jgi:hypothetical protein
MSRANRWFLYGPFIFAGLVIAFWFYLWRAGAETMRSSLSEFSQNAAEDSVTVTYTALKTRGFPFFLRGAVENFAVSNQRYRYRCDRLFIDALPYALDRLIFSCGGTQEIVANNETWTIIAKDGRASIERDKARGWMIRAETGSMTAQSSPAHVSAAAAIINLGPSPENLADLDASLRILNANVTMRNGAAVSVEQLDAAVSVSQKDMSGARVVALHGAETTINEAKLAAQGTLLLASNGALTGRLNAKLEKPVGLARALASAHLIGADEARATEAGLAMLTVASGGAIDAPIDFEEGEIRLGGIRLAKIRRAGQP